MDGSEIAGDLYFFGPFQLDPSRRRLTRAARELTLSPTALDVLIYLVANPGRVVTKDELLQAVWKGRTVEASNVKQTIYALRKSLGEEGERMILAAPGRGYRFAEIPRRGPIDQPIGEATAGDGPAARRRRVAVLGLAAGLLLGAGVLGWRLLTPPPAAHTVVLADFENSTGEAIFDRALASLLRTDLAQSPFLNLVPERQARQTLVQMTKSADAAITPALAQEICVRRNADEVVQGSIAKLGPRYLVTLSATECANDHVLAAEKAEVTSRDAVLPAIDKLIARLRSRVGESKRSIENFNVPMMDVSTGSLDALKAYSEGNWLATHGRLADALPLFRHATELDPKFASAYYSIGVLQTTLHNTPEATAALQKAYDLRDTVNERLKLQTTAIYTQYVTRDSTAAVANYRAWTALYPNDPSAWSDLANAETDLGDLAAAVAPADKTLALKPTFEVGYVVPARVYLGLNQFDRARAISTLAMKMGVGGDATHHALMREAFAVGDDAAVQREIAWAATAPSPRTTYGASEIDLCRGQVKASEPLFDRYGVIAGGRDVDEAGRSDRARTLADMGYRQKALDLLKPEPKVFQHDAVYTEAELGDAARAEAVLEAELRAHPSDTLLTKVFAPQTHAVLALRAGRPLEAVADLQPALPYQARDFGTSYLLGLAWLAAGDGAHAAAAFQTILDHRGWYPEAANYQLARLGLARAQHLAHNDTASLASYRTFLSDWRDADPDVPALKAAKTEYQRLASAPTGG